jgi:hypothetical protein
MNKLALCLAGVAAASSAIAVPNMQSRQEAGVPAVDCAGEVYDEVEDFNSWVMGCQLIVFPPSEPADFPAEFDNAENFNFTTPAPWHRFPLIHGGVPWSEGTYNIILFSIFDIRRLTNMISRCRRARP